MEENRKIELIQFVHFLGNILGDNVEIVLQIIEPDHNYIGAIVNGHISGRTKNAPLTGLALEMIKNKVYKKQPYIQNYKGITKDNRDIQASTYFIKSPEGELEAMLCFNVDISPYIILSQKILNLGNVKMDVQSDKIAKNHVDSPTSNGVEFVEYFSETLKDIIYSIVPANVLNSNVALKPEQKIEIVKILFDKGFFEVKGAVSQVAEILKVSEPSVYRYLKQVESTDESMSVF